MPFRQPDPFSTPIAEYGDKILPPATEAGRGRMSLNQGFPPETQVRPEAGGVPPHRHDFNGAFNLLSSHAVFQQYGGLHTFNPVIAEDGGYPLGAALAFSNPAIPLRVRSLKDNNRDDFNSDPACIGTSWAVEGPGPMPWNAGIYFAPPCMVFGPDGLLYLCVQPSGPGTANGPKEPGKNPGYWRELIRDEINQKNYLTAGTFEFVAPDDVQFDVTVIGAGGGTGGLRVTVSQVANGAGHRFSTGGAAGGGGARKVIRLSRGQMVVIVVGRGGEPGAAGNASTAATNGGTGGTSSFGDILSATGGAGSVAINVTALLPGIYMGNATWIGGVGLGGDINVTGNPGGVHPYRGLDLVTRSPGGAGPFFGGPGVDWGSGELSLGAGAAGVYVQGQNTPGYTAGVRGGDGAVIINWFGKPLAGE